MASEPVGPFWRHSEVHFVRTDPPARFQIVKDDGPARGRSVVVCSEHSMRGQLSASPDWCRGKVDAFERPLIAAIRPLMPMVGS
jgi:hypothetical protein